MICYSTQEGLPSPTPSPGHLFSNPSVPSSSSSVHRFSSSSSSSHFPSRTVPTQLSSLVSSSWFASRGICRVAPFTSLSLPLSTCRSVPTCPHAMRRPTLSLQHLSFGLVQPVQVHIHSILHAVPSTSLDSRPAPLSPTTSLHLSSIHSASPALLLISSLLLLLNL